MVSSASQRAKTSCMKKKIIMAGLAFMMVGAASAQKEAAPPQPPKPPKPPIENSKEIPPPPPPAPLPPDPPPPPAPPILSAEQIETLPNDYQAFLSRNPSVGSLRWNKEAVWVMLKDGKEERYLLNEEGIKQAEAKYGQLPVVPPPPPPLPPPPPMKHSKKTTRS